MTNEQSPEGTTLCQPRVEQREERALRNPGVACSYEPNPNGVALAIRTTPLGLRGKFATAYPGLRDIRTSRRSTLGWLTRSRIEKPNGSTWAQLSEAKRFAENCSAAVAAALWVLNKSGKL